MAFHTDESSIFLPPPHYSLAFFPGVVKKGGGWEAGRFLCESSAKLTPSPYPLVVVCLDYRGVLRPRLCLLTASLSPTLTLVAPRGFSARF